MEDLSIENAEGTSVESDFEAKRAEIQQRRARERALAESKKEHWITEGSKYIFKARSKEWEQEIGASVDMGFFYHIDETLDLMRRLDEGEALDSVRASIEEMDDNGPTLENLLNFSKRGPDIYEAYFTKNHGELPAQKQEYVDTIRAYNEVLAKVETKQQLSEKINGLDELIADEKQNMPQDKTTGKDEQEQNQDQDQR